MLFERPLPSFTKNIIYIGRPSNHKTRLEIIFSIFFWKQLPSTRHTTIWRLCRFHLSCRREIWQEKLSQVLDPLLFSRFFFRKPTQAHTSGFSHQSKIYRRCADKMPLYSWEVHVRFHCHPWVLQKRKAGERKKLVPRGGAMVKKKENWGGGAIDIPSPPPFTSDFKSNMACTCRINDRELLNVNSP